MIATDEYELVTTSAGALQRTGRAVFELSGGEAAEFLQGQVTNDVEGLVPGAGCYAALLDHKGKIRTDMRVLRTDDDRLIVEAEGIARALLAHTFETYSLGRDVRTEDVSESRTVVSLLGPGSWELLDAAPPSAEHANAIGELGVLVSTDVGVDVIADGDHVEAALTLAPAVSEEVAECLRVEAGRPRLGHELDDSTIPQEAGLNDRAVSFTKGCYVGQETVARLFYRGKPNRHLRGLTLDGPADPGTPIVLGEKEIGRIGSPASSPALGSIALAILRREAQPGDQVDVGGQTATVVELPFQR